MRLLLSVFLCMYGGSLLGSMWQYSTGPARAGAASVYGLALLSTVLLATTLILVWRPWVLEKMARQIGFMLLMFYGAMVAGAWAQKLAGPPVTSAGQLSLAALSFQGGTLILTHRFLREHHVGWQEAFGLAQHRWRSVLAGLILALAFLPIGWGLQHASAFILSQLSQIGVKPEEQQTVQVLRSTLSSADRLKMALVTILLAPIAEEILFRGILYAWIRQIGFPRLALWGTAAIFAMVHFNLVTFLPLLVLALMLALLYERTGNLLAPVAAHGMFNALNFALLFLDKYRPV